MRLEAAPELQTFDAIGRGLELDGYCVLENALPEGLCAALLQRARETVADFRPARVGRDLRRRRRPAIRSDRIRWLSPDDPVEARWLGWMQDLRLHLNRHQFLGLFHFESHFACYPPGARYLRHRDSFKGAANRVLSCVVYLNEDWTPEQGGELVIYAEDDRTLVQVLPCFATLVVFLSEDFPHEVLPAKRERFSVTGWFRVNDLLPSGIE